MGLFGFLFRKKANPGNVGGPVSDVRPKPVVVTVSGRFVQINGFELFGSYSKSPSGEWLICWAGGHREIPGEGRAENGKYILYNTRENRIVLTGELERPNRGTVADNGLFSIEDWLHNDDLASRFYVFSPSGEEIISRHFKANIFNSAISESGMYAVCQTCNSPNESDGSVFVAFDLIARTTLFIVHPEAGWAESYVFDEARRRFGVNIREVGTFYYTIGGVLERPDELINAKLASDDFVRVLTTAENLIKDEHLHADRARLILDGVIRARQIGADGDKGWMAIALKVQGVVLELLGRNQEALKCYDEALGLNAKIGVKRRADKLRQKIS